MGMAVVMFSLKPAATAEERSEKGDSPLRTVHSPLFPNALSTFAKEQLRMVGTRRSAAWILAASLIGFSVGCHKSSSATAPVAATPDAPAGGPGVFDAETGPFVEGKKALVTADCFRCHQVNGTRPRGGRRGPMAGGKMPGEVDMRGPGGPEGGPPFGPPGGGKGGFGGGRGGRAPDLAQVAKEPGHTADWIMKYVRNPKSVKADAKMPPFDANKIKDADLKALADYLVSLK